MEKGNLHTQMESSSSSAKASSLRWEILRQALLRRHSTQTSDDQSTKRISRKTTHGFNLIPTQQLETRLHKDPNSRDIRVCYTLPVDGAPNLILTQRVDSGADLSDFEASTRYNVDNTGLVCQWPSEDVLAYFCLSHPDLFRSKRVIELGSGYGLAGLAIAATIDALAVVITDGNPLVVDYIKCNIDANAHLFGNTKVKSMILHWDQEETSNISSTFDVIVASDCTFFKDFHNALACTIKLLLGKAGPSEALFFSPKRGDSLDKFLERVKENGLNFSVIENHDAEVWKRHEGFMAGDESWPSYEKDHCYPLLVRITL